jgi:hypothetical protein
LLSFQLTEDLGEVLGELSTNNSSFVHLPTQVTGVFEEEWDLDAEDIYMGVCGTCGDGRPIKIMKGPYMGGDHRRVVSKPAPICKPCSEGRKEQSWIG